MNFYDKINELTSCFKNTPEYKEFLALKHEIKKNDEKYKRLKDFKEKQTENQIQYMNTGKVDEKKQKELENLYSILIQDEQTRKLFENEMRLNILLADMQKMVGEAIKEVIEF